VLLAALGAVTLGIGMAGVAEPRAAATLQAANASEWWFEDYPELRRTKSAVLNSGETAEGPVGVTYVQTGDLLKPPGHDGVNLLRALVDGLLAGSCVYSRADGLLRERATHATFLCDVATARTDRVLARIVLDARVDPASRCTAVVALTRDETTATDLSTPLASIALDAGADPRLRRTALAGIRHRRIAPPQELLRLIDEPFFGLDRTVRVMFEDRPEAAALLARPEPSRHMAVRAVDSWESVSLCPAEKLDPAVASVLLLYDAEAAAKVSESLDRLARSVSADVAAARAPLAKLRAISSRLPVGGDRSAGDDDSDVTLALLSGGGNCVARSLIVAGVARRLGLPVRYVTCPSHMFLRWDDGETRQNFDPALGDESRSNAWYEAEFDCGPGVCIDVRPLDARQATSIVCSNKAWDLHAAGRDDDAAAWTERALELDPANHSALVARASALVRLAVPPSPDAAAALRAAERGQRWPVNAVVTAVRLWLALGMPQEAKRAVDASAALSHSNVRWAEVLYLTAAGDPEKAEVVAGSLFRGAAPCPESDFIRAAIARRAGRTSWKPSVPARTAEELISYAMLADWILGTDPAGEADARLLIDWLEQPTPQPVLRIARWSCLGTNHSEDVGASIALLRARIERIAAARKAADARR
jgi:tetratricopeptide (TPR) repeat protein